jgi:hypothetical protein
MERLSASAAVSSALLVDGRIRIPNGELRVSVLFDIDSRCKLTRNNSARYYILLSL